MSEHWSEEQTDDPHYADQRNFYKVEKWSRDSMYIEEMLYAGSNLDRARAIFASTVERLRLTIRQRSRVLKGAVTTITPLSPGAPPAAGKPPSSCAKRSSAISSIIVGLRLTPGRQI
jgi:hypothetical protein